ncbi:HNH endonuclease signature motif containing protein [Streptomyces omiyaensis]|uniref:HNH endonuclease signature motif containing protein n=1 Tax=Streptomyces omiyaensis TaxID=68247 RepID=A0ABW7BKN8_9ACTN
MSTALERGGRGDQDVSVWLMVLTAHQGLCVYCGGSASTTIDHEIPVAARGADIWWNFMPSCARCNRWKNGRSAREWVRDMDLHTRYPELRFSKRAMPARVYAGILRRVERTQRELADPDRRDWFRHHYDLGRHKGKAETLQALERCKEELRGYPHRPWHTPKVRDTQADLCVRLMCCGHMHPDAKWMNTALTDAEYEAFRRAAYRERLSPGELLGKAVRRYLADSAYDPDAQTPDAQTPDAQAPDAQAPDAQAPGARRDG